MADLCLKCGEYIGQNFENSPLCKCERPSTENLTSTFQKILNQEDIKEVNLLRSKKGNRVLIRTEKISNVIGKKGVCLRLIKHILETQFLIENPNISVLPNQITDEFK